MEKISKRKENIWENTAAVILLVTPQSLPCHNDNPDNMICCNNDNLPLEMSLKKGIYPRVHHGKNIQKKREYLGEHCSRTIQKKRIYLEKHHSKNYIQKKREYSGEHCGGNIACHTTIPSLPQ